MLPPRSAPPRQVAMSRSDGRTWLPHQGSQQGEAVAIGPLQVIHEDHDWQGPRQMNQKLAKRNEGLIAQLLGLTQRHPEIAFVLGEFQSAQDRKDLTEVRDAIGQDVGLVATIQSWPADSSNRR
jgi:hypothetical protein